jgi:hypothetical protein
MKLFEDDEYMDLDLEQDVPQIEVPKFETPDGKCDGEECEVTFPTTVEELEEFIVSYM